MRASSKPSPVRSFLVLVLALAVCFGVAGLGGLMTDTGPDSWYAQLEQPPWNPPDWVFGPVWTVLYALQAIAAWRVWRTAGRFAGPALTWFGIQLVLNLGWTALFFGLQAPLAALVEIGVLLLAIIATIIAFARHDRLAALLLVPYLAWVGFATALNAAIVALN